MIPNQKLRQRDSKSCSITPSFFLSLWECCGGYELEIIANPDNKSRLKMFHNFSTIIIIISLATSLIASHFTDSGTRKLFVGVLFAVDRLQDEAEI